MKTTVVSCVCPACVAAALSCAGLDSEQPFVIHSNLSGLPPAARRAFVDGVVAHAEGDVFLIVSAPVPAEFRAGSESEGETTRNASDPESEAAPTPADLEAMFGMAADEDEEVGH